MAQGWNPRGSGRGYIPVHQPPRFQSPRFMVPYARHPPPHMMHNPYGIPPVYHQNYRPHPPLPMVPPPVQPPLPSEPEPLASSGSNTFVYRGAPALNGANNNGLARVRNVMRSKQGRKRPNDTEQDAVPKTRIKHFKSSKKWNKADADKAEAAEKEIEEEEGISLSVTFPDFELSPNIVQNVARDDVQKVYFPTSYAARTCFLKLRPDSDVNAIIKLYSETKFGNGYPIVRISQKKQVDCSQLGDTINPYVLFLGNLPMNIHANDVKRTLPLAKRVDMGFSQKSKRTRYATLEFENVDTAIECLKLGKKAEFSGRTAICRFQRFKKSILEEPPTARGSTSEEVPDVEKVVANIKTEAFEFSDAQLAEMLTPEEVPACYRPESDISDEDEYAAPKMAKILPHNFDEDEDEEIEDDIPTPDEIRRIEENDLRIKLEMEAATDNRHFPPISIKAEPMDYPDEQCLGINGEQEIENAPYTGPPDDIDDEDDDFECRGFGPSTL